MTPPIIVSGFSRSGTSCMMNQFKIALGQNRIIGQEFPQFDAQLAASEQRDGEDPNAYAYRRYIFDKYERPRLDKDREKALDANQNGFWECNWTMNGLTWLNGMEDVIGDDAPKVVKVVCQGLRASNPNMVGKIILMLRDPQEIAKSFENAGNGNITMDAALRAAQGCPMPGNYIDAMSETAAWLKRYPHQVLIVDFKDMIEQPDAVLTNVREFIGEGDFSNHTIEPKQYRAKWRAPDGDPLWDAAKRIYHCFLVADWDGAIQAKAEVLKIIQRENGRWRCARTGVMVKHHDCIQCHQSEKVRESNKTHAEQMEINWRNEPCGFECAHADGELKTLKESVEQNHWR